MMPREKLRKADVISSLALIVLGAGTIAASLRMPLSGTYGGRPIHWYTSPAFFPMLLGALLIIVALGVLARALRQGGHRNLVPTVVGGLTALPANRRAHRILLLWGILGAYILLLSWHPFGGLSRYLERVTFLDASLTRFLKEPEGVNYVLSSSLFLCAFLFSFYLPTRVPPRWKHGLLVVILSLAVAWAVAYIFTQHLFSPLPWSD